MKIIDAAYRIHRISPPDAIQEIAYIARKAYQSHDNKKLDDAELVKRLYNDVHHYSVFEFADLVVEFDVNRGVTHEIVRHRLASFLQESTRFCNYSRDRFDNQITVIRPLFDISSEAYKDWFDTCIYCEQKYLKMTREGISAQEARDVLPHALKAEIVLKANFREWFTVIFPLRNSMNAHPHMRAVIAPLFNQMIKIFPLFS